MSFSLSKSFRHAPCDAIYYAPDDWATYSQLFKLCLSAEAAKSVRAPRSMDWPGNCAALTTAEGRRHVWLAHPLAGYSPTSRQTILQHVVHTARTLILLDGKAGRIARDEIIGAAAYARAMGVRRAVLFHEGNDAARLRELVHAAGYPDDAVLSVPTKLRAALKCRCGAADCEDCRAFAAWEAALSTERAVSTNLLLPVEGSDHLCAFGIRAGAFVVRWPLGETRPLPVAAGAPVDLVTKSAVHRLAVAEIAPNIDTSWGPGMVFQAPKLAWREVVGVVSPAVGATHAEKLELLRRYRAGELVRF